MNNLNFRAWHKELKEMEPVLLMCFVNQYVNVLPARNLEGGSQEQWNFKDVVLMQSTGLKDSKGVEIFEGDILKTIYDGDESIHTVINGTDDGYPAFDLDPNDSDCNLLAYIFQGGIYESYKVIGNIYQHPEILGVKDD